jgi:hypothetical protein
LLLRRRAGEGSERWRRGLGPPREMIEDFLDHHWIFDARNAVQGCTNAARAGCAGAIRRYRIFPWAVNDNRSVEMAGRVI